MKNCLIKILPIKKLVKDIGNLNNLTIKETRNFFLYDDSNLITNTFFTEINKKIYSVTVTLRYFIITAMNS